MTLNTNKYNYALMFAYAGMSIGTIVNFTLFKDQSLAKKTGLVAASIIFSSGPWICKKVLYLFTPPPRLNDIEGYQDFHQFILNHDQFRSLPADINFADYQNNNYEIGQKRWDSNWDHRMVVLASSRKIIKKIFQKHVEDGSTILEIGSNKLFLDRETETKKYSFLGTLVPKKLLGNLTYSDYILPPDYTESPDETQKYLHLDLRKDSLSHDQKNTIVAINVVDVMKREDLAPLAIGMYNSLKNKGKVLLLADRPFEYNPLFAKFSDPNLFVFPCWEDESCNTSGVKIVQKRLLLEAINRLDSDHKSMVTEIVNFTPIQRFFYFKAAMSNKPLLFAFFDKLIKNLSHEFHSPLESFEEDTIKAFESNGFKTIEQGFKEHSIIYPTDALQDPYWIKEFNTVKLDPREGNSLKKFNSNEVPAGNRKITACFHTIIFEKKE